MADKTNIEQVMEVLRESHSRNPNQDGEQYAEEWLNVKNIDTNSLDKVLNNLIQQAVESVMGTVVTTGGNPEAIAVKLRSLLGTGIELGYTTCEVQLEGMFTD